MISSAGWPSGHAIISPLLTLKVSSGAVTAENTVNDMTELLAGNLCGKKRRTGNQSKRPRRPRSGAPYFG